MMILAMALAMNAQDCRNAVTQADMTRCAIRDFEAADAALNRQWKATLASERAADARGNKDGRPSYGDQLLKAQRAWIVYRDEHCRSDGYRMRGGSAEPMLVAGCRAELTRARTKQLAALIEKH